MRWRDMEHFQSIYLHPSERGTWQFNVGWSPIPCPSLTPLEPHSNQFDWWCSRGCKVQTHILKPPICPPLYLTLWSREGWDLVGGQMDGTTWDCHHLVLKIAPPRSSQSQVRIDVWREIFSDLRLPNINREGTAKLAVDSAHKGDPSPPSGRS